MLAARISAFVLAALLVVGGVVASSLHAPPLPESGPPVSGAGDAEVVLSADAAAHPAGEAVRAQLQRHFSAINARDYAAWAGTVVPERAAALPEPDWQAAYASTRDGSIRVDRIDDRPGGVLVRVRFVSTQDVAAAPPAAPAPRVCWRTSLPMSGTPPVIELTAPGVSAPERC